MQFPSLSQDLARFAWERGHLGRFRSGRDARAPRVGMSDSRKLNDPDLAMLSVTPGVHQPVPCELWPAALCTGSGRSA